MPITYQVRYKKNALWKGPILTLRTGKEPGMSIDNMPGNIITDDYLGKKLLEFVNQTLEGKRTDEYWTNGYTAKVVEKEGKKMLKIFFRLTDDYEPSYISPNDFKELLEIWIRERQEFEKNPEEYKEKLKERGGIIDE